MATMLDYYKPNHEKRSYWLGILLSVDQFANALLWGYVDETLSSRSHRCNDKKRWAVMEKVVNTLFFWDKQVTPNGVMRHCEMAYYGELAREHFSTRVKVSTAP